MSISFGDVVFDNVFYDREVDVLYVHQGSPGDAVEFDACPEGHHTRYDAAGRLVGVTVLNARWLLDRDGVITVTLADRVLRAHDLGDVATPG